MLNDSGRGKGRCDLLPLDILCKYLWLFESMNSDNVDYRIVKHILGDLYTFLDTRDVEYLYKIIAAARDGVFRMDIYSVFLEVSFSFEEDADKWGVDGWKKQIGEWEYIDSAIKHLLKWARGDEDERHERAFIWNIICLLWYVENYPLNKKEEDKEINTTNE